MNTYRIGIYSNYLRDELDIGTNIFTDKQKIHNFRTKLVNGFSMKNKSGQIESIAIPKNAVNDSSYRLSIHNNISDFDISFSLDKAVDNKLMVIENNQYKLSRLNDVYIHNQLAELLTA